MHGHSLVGTKSQWTVPIGVGFLITLLYWFSATPNLALAHDSAMYLAAIESGSLAELLHPHHLLYKPLSVLWLTILRSSGLAVDGALGVAWFNGIAGGLCVGLIIVLLTRLGVSRPIAVLTALAVGLSFGLWFYSACVEVYIIPLALLLGTLLVSLGKPSLGRAGLIGLLHGFAMVFHQIHVLFGLVLLVVLITWTPSIRLKSISVYILSGSIVVLTFYGVTIFGILNIRSADEAWTWFTLYAQDGEYVHPLAMSTFVQAAVGAVRSIVGGHFAFALIPIQQALANAFPDKVLIDEIYLVRHIPQGGAVVLLLATIVTGLAIVVLAGMSLNRLLPGTLQWKSKLSEKEVFVRALLVWLGVYSLFFLFWDPFNVEFWIPQATVLWMLIGVGLMDAGRWVGRVLGGLVVALFLVNGFGTVFPARHASNDAFSVRLEPLDGYLDEDDVLILSRKHILGPYATLRFGSKVIGLTELVQEEPLDQVVERVQRLLVASEATSQCIVLDKEAIYPDAVTRAVGGEVVDVLTERLMPLVDTTSVLVVRNQLATYYLSSACRTEL